MPDDPKRTRIFICNPDAGEPWTYCGAVPAKDAHPEEWALLAANLGAFITGEMGNDFGGQDDNQFTIAIKRQDMTDAEVEALPED